MVFNTKVDFGMQILSQNLNNIYRAIAVLNKRAKDVRNLHLWNVLIDNKVELNNFSSAWESSTDLRLCKDEINLTKDCFHEMVAYL